MDESARRSAISYDEFLVRVAAFAPSDIRAADPSSLLIADLGLSDVQLFQLLVEMHREFDGFHLPDQFDILDVRVRDLYYYAELSLRD
jgi:hypothetical protein